MFLIADLLTNEQYRKVFGDDDEDLEELKVVLKWLLKLEMQRMPKDYGHLQVRMERQAMLQQHHPVTGNQSNPQSWLRYEYALAGNHL
ncbi:hypothetical protein HMI54_010859 [Coelomomyces lativittatus]|nr:hypothetical protein HMI56_004323 [Coelomomyces lativittatus]KAJ1500397.1 hypothetical protein HMI54_010859 [Coelomomyces lativittatus]